MATLHRNRVKMTVSGTPGTGTITLGSASSGYQSFATAYGANATVDILIQEGTAWEVARSCTYTNSGTTVTRGTFEESSTGSAISFTSAAIVSQIPTAAWGNYLEAALEGVLPGGRLTLTTGVPVTTSDVTGATNVYYTPYLSDVIALWNGARWQPLVFAEITHALGTVTSGLPYDFFAYISSGAVAIEKLAWTNATTRATGISLQDGRYCKTGDKTRLYLGSCFTTSTTTTEDSAGGTTTQIGGKRYLFNMYNRVRRHILVKDTTASWAYRTSTWRQANAAAGNKVEFLVGVAEVEVSAMYLATLAVQGNTDRGAVGVGLDTTTSPSGRSQGGYNGAFVYVIAACAGDYEGIPAVGYHYLSAMERGATDGGTGDCQFTGNDATSGQCGLKATLLV